MAEQSTDPVADVTDTSTEEVLNPEAAFDEDDVPFEESVEATEQADEDDEDEQEDTEPVEPEEESTDDEDDTPEAPVEEKSEPSDAEKQKAFNKEMAEKRIQAKQEREQAIREQQDKYLDGIDQSDPLAVATAQNQIELYNIKIEGNTNKLTNGYERAVKDFEILNSDDPVIKQAVDEAIDAFQAMHVKLDMYGNPLQITGDLYQYLQTKADSIEKLTGLGVRKQKSDKGRERSKTLTPPVRSPKEPKSDPDLDAFDEEADRW